MNANLNLKKLLQLPEVTLLLVILLIIIIFSMTNGQFFSLGNFYSILEVQSVNLIFALGLLVVLISGGIDISFLAIASIAQYAMAISFKLTGLDSMASIFVGLGVGIAVGILLGVINALAIYYLNLTAIIITILSEALFFGLLMYFTNGTSVYDLPDWLSSTPIPFSFQSGSTYIDITIPIIVSILLACATGFILNKMSVGRRIFAVGGDVESARRIGINIKQSYMLIYGFMGFMASCGGITQVMQVQEVVPNSLYGQELDILAGVVIGGVSLAGGRGTVCGTILGLFLIAIIKNGLTLMGVPSYYNKLIVGLIILTAIVIVGLRTRKPLI